MSEHPQEALLLALAEEGPQTDADPELGAARQHATRCEVCRQRLEEAREVLSLLRVASPLGRSYCPSREVLAELSDASPSASLLKTHLAACPLCRDDLRDLRSLRGEALGEATTWGATIVILWEAAGKALRALEGSLPASPLPALAPLRGAGQEGGLLMRAPCGEGHLELTWTPSAEGVDLRLQAQEGAPRAYRVALEEEAGILESRSADPGGGVNLAGLEPGRYRLLIFLPHSTSPALALEVDLREPGPQKPAPS